MEIEFGGVRRTIPVPPDRPTLRRIAEDTGGKFFDAPSADALASAYEELDSLLSTEPEPMEATFAFLGAAALLLLLAGGFSAVWWRPSARPSACPADGRPPHPYAPRVDADPAELRVLGCLIEKQRTTPDAYPLSLNSLRLACNQSTNRDPVVEYDEPTIRWALDELSRRGWVRLASGAGSRAIKYRHLFDEALGLADDEISLLAVLMLRGPQTPGELARARSACTASPPPRTSTPRSTA